MLSSLVEGDLDYFATYLENYILNVVSYFDIPKKPKIRKRKRKEIESTSEKLEEELPEEELIATPEQMYHLFVLGFIAGLHGKCYQIQSNRESGYGRYDLILSPSDPKRHGIIFEFKAAEKPSQLEKYSQDALTQIHEKRYQVDLERYGVQRGLHIGIAFCGKHLEVAHEWCDYKPTAEFHLPSSPYSPPAVTSPQISMFGEDKSSSAPQLEQRILRAGQLPGGEMVTFEIHPTQGDGNCGFYALPIADDRQGVRDLLLANAQNPNIRALVAPEIRDIVISGHLPINMPDHQFYAGWKQLYSTLQELSVDQPQIDQHIALLQNYTNTETAFRNFVNFDIGGSGRLAYYTQPENTSVLDAVAQLANLRIFVYQYSQATNTLEFQTARGPEDGSPTYLHHCPGGTDTHFELMSIAEHVPESENLPSSSASTSSSSSTTFFAQLQSSQMHSTSSATSNTSSSSSMTIQKTPSPQENK